MKIDDELKEMVTKVKSVFDAKGVDSCIIGAFVPYLKIGLKLKIESPETHDVDYVVGVQSWQEFDAIKSALELNGFKKTQSHHRMTYGNHSIVDLIPYSDSMARDGKLVWPKDGPVMNVAGFERLFEDSQEEELFGGISGRVASIPLFVLNKILAYEDRKLSKDLSAIKYCLIHYGEDDSDRRFAIIGETGGLVWDNSGAYLIGVEMKCYLNEHTTASVDQFLQQFSSFEAPVIDLVFRGEDRIVLSDDDRESVLALFVWFAKGLGRLS